MTPEERAILRAAEETIRQLGLAAVKGRVNAVVTVYDVEAGYELIKLANALAKMESK